MTDKEIPRPLGAGSKLLLDLGPLVLFFAANGFYGIVTATASFVAATAVSLTITYGIERRIAPMPLVGSLVVLIFGALTVALDDATFIKLKPTVANGFFAAVLLAGLAMKKPILKRLFGAAIRLDDEGWRILSWRWAGFFALSALANEIAWRHLSTDAWVTFKVFGLVPAAILFAMLQAPLIQRRQSGDEDGDGTGAA